MMILYDYFRSSAAHRVRLALAIKNLPYERRAMALLDDEHRQEAFQRTNPQSLLPALLDGPHTITQSLAICEYLDEAYPQTVPLVWGDAVQRAHIRAMAQLIACDVHPLNNLRVLRYLEHEWHIEQEARDGWYRHWIVEGFRALEVWLSQYAGLWAYGKAPSLVDVCLQPQICNARRFEIPLQAYPCIERLAAHYTADQAFQSAHPDTVAPATS